MLTIFMHKLRHSVGRWGVGMNLPVHSYLSGKYIRHSPSMFSYLLSPMLFFLQFCQNIKLQHKNTVTENVFVVGFGLWHFVGLLYDIYSLGHWKLKRIFWHSSKFLGHWKQNNYQIMIGPFINFRFTSVYLFTHAHVSICSVSTPRVLL